MNQLGLIGYPLSHSFSKKYFSEKFLKNSIDNWSYELYPIENIEKISSVLSNPSLRGLNVTIPYKEQVIPYLDELDETAKQIGAVNTIVIENGKTKGYNTDVIGFSDALTDFLGNQIQDIKAIVLGTGGAAKAVEYSLSKFGIEFVRVSRKKTSQAISYTEITKELMISNRLIINTTPLGMSPLVDTSPEIPYEWLTSNHFLYDLVYNPNETKFMKEGINQDAAVMNGLSMLIGQAEGAWKIWSNGN